MGMVPKPRVKPCVACGAAPHTRSLDPRTHCCGECRHPLADRQTWLGRYA